MGLDVFAKDTVQARKRIADAFERYFRNGLHGQASALIKAHYAHSIDYKLPLQDLAKLEVGAALGVLSNIVPTTFWLLYHLFANPHALQLCRKEVENATKESADAKGRLIRTIDVSDVKSSCPTLLSSFRETLRLHTVGASARLVMEDFMLDGKFLLRKGALVLLPQSVQHTDQSVWGSNVGIFDCERFLKANKRTNAVEFRGFGGGTTLCPGRHFATTEVLAYTAMFIMRFDIEPRHGRWVQPTTENSGMWTVTAGPDYDVGVECRSREGVPVDMHWRLSLSKSDHVMSLAAEDLGTR